MEGITPVIVAGAWPPTTHDTTHWCPGQAMSDSLLPEIVKAIRLTQPVKQMCMVNVFVLARLSASLWNIALVRVWLRLTRQ